MAAHSTHTLDVGRVFWLIALFCFSQAMGHSGGCVWNDICDRDIDGLVGKSAPSHGFCITIATDNLHAERSKLRPLVAGTVSVHHAVYLVLLIHGFTMAILGICGYETYVTLHYAGSLY